MHGSSVAALLEGFPLFITVTAGLAWMVATVQPGRDSAVYNQCQSKHVSQFAAVTPEGKQQEGLACITTGPADSEVFLVHTEGSRLSPGLLGALLE